MLEEGLFEKIKPDAAFALHVMPGRSGEISYRSGPTTASCDTPEITIIGKQGHGGMPWNTVDPITTSALVISGLQTVVSRKANLTASPVVVTIGTINGGTGPNIVPETVQMSGTIRTYDEKVREQAHRDIRLTAEKIAESAGAKAKVSISKMYETTVNDEVLAARMAPVIKRAADGQVAQAPLAGASEDFSFFAKEVPVGHERRDFTYSWESLRAVRILPRRHPTTTLSSSSTRERWSLASELWHRWP
jgi:amidohydrolase